MTQYAQHFSTLKTPQSEKAEPNQVKNSAGGYSFQVDKWQQLNRWLILGSDGGSYYASERKLTRDNAKSIIACLDDDGPRTVKTIADISQAGRAPKNDAAIFALAIAAGHADTATRQAALAALPDVCRTGTHLFQFVGSVGNFRGWGRALCKAVARWYDKPERDLCYQIAKYRQREGWSHRDVLRQCHATNLPQGVARYIVAGADGMGDRELSDKHGSTRRFGSVELPAYLEAFEELKTADWKRTIQLVKDHRFTHEMINSEHKSRVEVWEALLETMPMGAMLRNLGKMTEVGLLKPMSAATATVAGRLGDADRIRKARLHPLSVLQALMVYQQGRGVKGSLRWDAERAIVDALDGAFYTSFGNVNATGKRTLLALDVSGSMTWNAIAGMEPITPRVGSAALAMVTAEAEPVWHCVGFTGNGTYHNGTLTNLNISPRKRLDDTINNIDKLMPGPTDCAAPMLYAAGNNLDVDTFIIYTDSETWHGDIHPHQALKAYRNKSGIEAKMAVVAMVPNSFTIRLADPDDQGTLDVVGFDTFSPNLLASFSGGW